MKTRAFTRRPLSQAISLILGSTVLGSTIDAGSRAGCHHARRDRRHRHPRQPRIVDEPEARRAGRGRRHRRRGHRQVPGHQSRRVAAAHQRRVDRPLDRRRLEASRFAASARTSTWCCSTAGRCRRSSLAGHGRFELARLRLRESRLRSDRGDRGLQDQPRRARRPAASARRSTSRPRVRSTLRACTPASASRA